jgi:phosphatidylglycerol lysyltransferase
VSPDQERARALILRHGWNTTSYQLINPGIELWFSSTSEGVVGYVSKAGTRVVAGAPVCAEADFDQVVTEWEADCRRARKRICYFGAEGRMRHRAGMDSGYSTAILGAQPIWSPASLVERFLADASLRAQRSRAVNKGVEVVEWPASKANNHPKLCEILGQWLTTRGLPPMHFLVEPETLTSLAGRRVFVAEKAGVPVAFLVLSPVPARAGWLTEQFVRGHDAPNGAVELLMFEAARAAAAQADQLVTMGIVPLAQRGPTEDVRNPAWLNLVASWARAHGRRFYNFQGLEWFKDKFHPDFWEPIYAISKEPQFSVRTLYAIAAAFTGESPLLTLPRALVRALRSELLSLQRVVRNRLRKAHEGQR